MSRERESEAKRRWNRDSARGLVTPEDTPPLTFIEWWKGHDHCPQYHTANDGRRGYGSGISAHKAWQCECYQLEFRERGHEHAGGTGVNYVYYGWHRTEDAPRTSDSKFLDDHAKWCATHRRPDPRISKPMPEALKTVCSLTDAKDVLDYLCEKMDMNKRLGWTDKDNEIANRKKGEIL